MRGMINRVCTNSKRQLGRRQSALQPSEQGERSCADSVGEAPEQKRRARYVRTALVAY